MAPAGKQLEVLQNATHLGHSPKTVGPFLWVLWHTLMMTKKEGAAIAEWQTGDEKVTGLIPDRSSRFFSRVSCLCWLSLLSIPPPLVSIPPQDPVILPAGCRLWTNTCTICRWLWIQWCCKLVHGCEVYTEHVPRQQQFPHGTNRITTNITVHEPLQWVFKNTLCKATVTHSVAFDKSTVVSWEAENSAA